MSYSVNVPETEVNEVVQWAESAVLNEATDHEDGTYVSQIKRRLGCKVRSKGRATPEYIARVRAEQIATSMAGELSLNWLQKSW